MIKPLIYLGAASEGSLTLPRADPTPAYLYAPRGVYLDDEILIVADSGNHRVMIWHTVPKTDGQAADVVLGQTDFHSEGPCANGNSIEKGFHLPTGVSVIDGRLILADAWNHRLLIWNSIPTSNYVKPDVVIGQDNLENGEPNRDGPINSRSLYWPYGFGFVGGIFYVADTGNRRILGWEGIPEAEQPADFVIGQDSFELGNENRGREVGPNTYRWPHDIAGNDNLLLVADAGNHRILGWDEVLKKDRPAGMVLGQKDDHSSFEMPHMPQGAQRLRFPYAISLYDQRLAVADTANNRVLLWDDVPSNGFYTPADHVLGQHDFNAAGENRWEAVLKDTLCWPYGLCQHKNLLAIADSGNNRVVIWDIGTRSEYASTVMYENSVT